ncbi:hypothetical protein L9F63_014902, partial [Diploptera punctata]
MYCRLKINNFLSSIIPLYYLSKLLGLTPFYLYGNDTNSSKCKILYSLIIISCVVGLCIHQIYYYSKYIYINETDNFMMSDICSKLLLYGMPFVSIAVSILKRKQMYRILKGINFVKEHFDNKININIISFWVLIFQIMLAICFLLGLYEMVYLTWGLNPFFNFYYESFVHVISLIVDFQYINSMIYVKHLFKSLNKQLHLFCYLNVDNNESVFIKKLTYLNARKLLIVYKDLEEITKLINSYFAYQLVLETVSLFIQLVSTLYNTINIISSIKSDTKWQVQFWLILCLILWITFYLTNLLTICVSGHLCKREAHAIFITVHKLLLNRFMKKEILKDLQDFVIFCSYNKLVVSANGIFHVDMTHFRKVIEVVIVYLAILLQ